MATKTVGVSFPEHDIPALQKAAEAAGTSFSAYVARAAKDRWMAEQGRKAQQVLDSLPPEDKQAIEALYEVSRQAMDEVNAQMERAA